MQTTIQFAVTAELHEYHFVEAEAHEVERLAGLAGVSHGALLSLFAHALEEGFQCRA